MLVGEARLARDAARDAEHPKPLGRQGRHVPRQRLRCCAGVRWQRSAMASGAPLAATTTSSPFPVRHAWLTASRPGVSGYSRASDQPGCRCSVSLISRSPAACSARSIGSKGSRLLARIAFSSRPCSSSGSAPSERREVDGAAGRRQAVAGSSGSA